MINEMTDREEVLSVCPSFNSYLADRIAEIATGINTNDAPEDENDDDFEFPLAIEEQRFLAEEFFYDGQIKQVFPVFNRDRFVTYDDYDKDLSDEGLESITIPSKKNLLQNRKNEYASSSASEADDLETIPTGTYCVWRPKDSKSSPSQCKKSNSTGSGSASKRWKFRDLLRRCNSEGKDSFIFFTPKHKEGKPKEIENSKYLTGKRIVSGEKSAANSPHEALYVRNRTIKGGDKRKSYLPYRQDLVGFFPSANGLSRSCYAAF